MYAFRQPGKSWKLHFSITTLINNSTEPTRRLISSSIVCSIILLTVRVKMDVTKQHNKTKVIMRWNLISEFKKRDKKKSCITRPDTEINLCLAHCLVFKNNNLTKSVFQHFENTANQQEFLVFYSSCTLLCANNKQINVCTNNNVGTKKQTSFRFYQLWGPTFLALSYWSWTYSQVF